MCCEEAVMEILYMSILLKYLAMRAVVFVGTNVATCVI